MVAIKNRAAICPDLASFENHILRSAGARVFTLRAIGKQVNKPSFFVTDHQQRPNQPVAHALANGVEVADGMDVAALDATLAPLSIEQRIAVKSQMAKAGLIA